MQYTTLWFLVGRNIHDDVVIVVSYCLHYVYLCPATRKSQLDAIVPVIFRGGTAQKLSGRKAAGRISSATMAVGVSA